MAAEHLYLTQRRSSADEIGQSPTAGPVRRRGAPRHLRHTADDAIDLRRSDAEQGSRRVAPKSKPRLHGAHSAQSCIGMAGDGDRPPGTVSRGPDEKADLIRPDRYVGDVEGREGAASDG